MARSFRMNLSLDSDLHVALEEIALDQRRSLGDVIRDLLRESVFGSEADGPIKGVGELARQLILDGLPNKAVLDAVQKKFPEAQTTADSISWYRSQLRREGKSVPTSLEAQRAMKTK